jgi:hypothetical protein
MYWIAYWFIFTGLLVCSLATVQLFLRNRKLRKQNNYLLNKLDENEIPVLKDWKKEANKL